MQAIDKIPKQYVDSIADILRLTFYMRKPEVECAGRFLRRSYLRMLVLDHQKQMIEALTWAVDHPDISYQSIWDTEFSNPDCIKVFKFFIDHIKHVYDDGPDMVPDRPWTFVPDDKD